ncbi:neurotrimin-like [Tigriopus californicus]|uniref:neurotrimin-like n=1 Tax=Tigriopus californicus TaxID=6832 RepID=UPI0027DA68E7|nr:neurotrimin-like [Tigriopus californicus]
MVETSYGKALIGLHPKLSLIFQLLVILALCSDASQKVSTSLGPKGQNLSRDVTVKAREGAPDTPDAYFESSPPQNVSALMGKTAFLTCVVRNLGKAKSVTWIRHRDVHILTVGEYTYTTDERFVARHNRDTDEWVLVIKYVQDRDAGTYACQIPSSPPRSYPVNLNIIVPHVRIQGSPDIHVNQGSVINLTCIISYSPEAPAFIFWYHGDQVVPYDSESGRFSVNTEKLGRETRSHLVIYDASPNRDSGNYTCKPSIAKAASIKVHVLESEFPGALQESSSTSLKHCGSAVALCLFILLASLFMETKRDFAATRSM